MDCIITVFKWVGDNAIPVAEIRWAGKLPTNGTKFALKHGGDFIEIQDWDEYIELQDYS
jgi:hypothetical protein